MVNRNLIFKLEKVFNASIVFLTINKGNKWIFLRTRNRHNEKKVAR